jgi:F-type H+-transporting ATPase subunit delta
MDTGRVSSNYARAFLDWTNEKNLSDQAYMQSKPLLKFIDENPEFSEMLCSHGVSIKSKQRIVSTILLEFAPEFKGIFSLIINNRREKQLKTIILQYQKLYRENKGIVKTQIESATGLTDKNIDSIKNYLAVSLNKKVEIEHKINPNLIGGFTLTIEDRLMDKSVKGELELLRRKFSGI